MTNKKHIFLLILLISVFFTTKLSARTNFSGYAGGKLNYGGNPVAESYDPDLTLQAFFAGQFNFTQNMWSHVEVSIDTEDLLSESIFHETPTIFQIDELSWIMRNNMNNGSNYFSVFMGTYDPIGSDVFLQRYFGIEPIGSKITDSYLGLAGSILYPHFGLGISDVIKFFNKPMALGGYIYFNHEDENYFVLNTDLRFASVFRYFTCDIACGLGAPLSDKYKDEELIVAIDKLYWHLGATLLFGNNYTTSLFIQAGIYNASFTGKEGSFTLNPEDLYILVEPRFVAKNFHINLTAYSLPRKTVKKLLFVEDCIGVDVNLYNENVMMGPQKFTLGSHLSFSIKNKTITDLGNTSTLFSDGYNITITPYISTNFLSGEVHIQSNIKCMEFANSIGKALSVDVGYRTRF